MTIGIVDSTVLIHILRGNLVAEAWSTAQPARLSITPITWLEVIYGAPSKRVQASTEAVLNRFDMVYLDPSRYGLGDATTAYLSFEPRYCHYGLFDCFGLLPLASSPLYP